MDLFEKQQRVDAIRGMVKARWLAIVFVVGLGLILKMRFFSWAPRFEPFTMLGVGFVVFSYNFIYWFFIRRPIEKIGLTGLVVVSTAQVVVDGIIFAIIFYYAGTIESINFILFFITILIASSLYKTKGIILAGALASALFSAVVLAEYFRLIPHIPAYPEAVWFGIPEMTRSKIISFIFYMATAVVFSAFLSNLFKKRIKSLREQSDKLIQQTRVLSVQTQELTQTKDWLHDALTKSDKARVESEEARAEAEKARQELGKANLELKAKIDELEKYGKVTVGREIKMVELKDKIKVLEERIKELEKKERQ